MIKRRFKKKQFTAKEGGNFCIYEPTIKVKGSVLVSDKFHKKQRERLGGFDTPFVIKAKKRKC